MNLAKTFQYLEPKTSRNLLVLFITGLSFWISLTLLVPTLPTYIADVGGTKRDVGLVMGSFAIGLLACRSWLGKLADQRGRKIVLILGAIVAAIAPLGYLAVDSIPLLIVTRAFHGISIAAFTTGYSALVVDLSPAKHRGELIGYMSLAVPIGMALGPALGSFLQEYGGYQALFLVSSLAGMLALILANLVREDQGSGEDLLANSPVFPRHLRDFWELLTAPPLLVITLILFLVGSLFGGLVTFLPLYIRESQLQISAGLFYTCAALASFTGRILSGRASDLYGRGIFVTGSLVSYGLAMLILATSQSEQGIILAALLEGTGGGILIPLLMTLIADRSYPHERGKVFAICLGGFDVGMALAGPILGFLDINYQVMFGFASSFALIALLIFFTTSNPTVRSSSKFALGLGKDRYALDQSKPLELL